MLSEHYQLLDPECRALWNNKLRQWEVTKINRLWGFKDTHYGAITLTLGENMTALFKPCSTKAEDIRMEIVGSQLDFVMEFGNNAPVVSRRIPLSIFEDLISTKEEKNIIKETKETCAVGDYLEGVMIGWREHLTSIQTQKKTKYSIPTLLHYRIALAPNLYKAQKVSRFHTLYWLIGILRWGKDEFITPEGDLVALDLDRSNYHYTIDPRSSTLNFTWCFTCYMEKSVYQSFYDVHHSNFRLSSLMKFSLADDPVFGSIYASHIGRELDIRVERILECISDCIKLYGEENVLLDVHPPSDPQHILNTFIDAKR